MSEPGDNQAVNSFDPASLPHRIAAVPGVAGVQAFNGGFLQMKGRRVWVIARPPGAERDVLAAEVKQGSVTLAERRLSSGGWVVVSEQLAEAEGARIGAPIALPTPTGMQRFRVAATTTNLAWPPGVIFMGSADWARHFAAPATTTPTGPAAPADLAAADTAPTVTALGVTLAPHASPPSVRKAITIALGPRSGLEVSLASTRAAKIDALASAGLGQLREVSTMLLIAAVIAMVAAIGSSVWQRRQALAGLRLFGARTLSLQALLLLEALLMLSAGCLTGAITGVYGQLVIDSFLRHVTGFPLASPTTSARPIEVLALVLIAALLVGALPSWLAARVSPALAVANE